MIQFRNETKQKLLFLFRQRAVKIAFFFTLSAVFTFYELFDLYLLGTGKSQTIQWVVSNNQSISSGRLLNTLTKQQKLILSTGITNGLKLIKLNENGLHQRFASGNNFEISARKFELNQSKLRSYATGFFRHQITLPVGSEPNLFLVTEIYSNGILILFLICSAVIISAFYCYLISLYTIYLREYKERAQFVKETLNATLYPDLNVTHLENTLPEVTKWWNHKKLEFLDTQNKISTNRTKILISEVISELTKSPLFENKSIEDSSLVTNLIIQKINSITDQNNKNFSFLGAKELFEIFRSVTFGAESNSTKQIKLEYFDYGVRNDKQVYVDLSKILKILSELLELNTNCNDITLKSKWDSESSKHTIRIEATNTQNKLILRIRHPSIRPPTNKLHIVSESEYFFDPSLEIGHVLKKNEVALNLLACDLKVRADRQQGTEFEIEIPLVKTFEELVYSAHDLYAFIGIDKTIYECLLPLIKEAGVKNASANFFYFDCLADAKRYFKTLESSRVHLFMDFHLDSDLNSLEETCKTLKELSQNLYVFYGDEIPSDRTLELVKNNFSLLRRDQLTQLKIKIKYTSPMSNSEFFS